MLGGGAWAAGGSSGNAGSSSRPACQGGSPANREPAPAAEERTRLLALAYQSARQQQADARAAAVGCRKLEFALVAE